MEYMHRKSKSKDCLADDERRLSKGMMNMKQLEEAPIAGKAGMRCGHPSLVICTIHRQRKEHDIVV